MDWYIWLAIIIFLIFVEVITVNLTTIWFVASGIIALMLSFITDSIFIQFGVFVIMGVILLFTTRDTLVKWLTPKKDAKINLDRIIKADALVTLKITNKEPGEVKVDGKRWTAISDETLDVGEMVKAIKIDGVKLIVKKEDN